MPGSNFNNITLGEQAYCITIYITIHAYTYTGYYYYVITISNILP